MSKVEVTVIKRLNMDEIFQGNLPSNIDRSMVTPQCDHFKEGQEYIMDLSCPPGFCSWAYADIQRDVIHVLFGGNYPWVGDKVTAISCCSDGLRPVIFKIERIEYNE